MAADFVRYSPDIETFDPNLEEWKVRDSAADAEAASDLSPASPIGGV